jgi:hypothetical protein
MKKNLLLLFFIVSHYFLYAADLSVTGFISPGSSSVAVCYSNAETVTATITNTGGTLVNFSTTPATVTCKITGVLNTTLTYNLTGTLGAGVSMNISFATTINMYALGTYNFSVYSSLPGDANLNNDTLPLQSRTSGIVAGTVTTTTPGFCISGAPTLIYSNPAQNFQWAYSADGTSWSYSANTNDTVTFPTITGTYYYKIKLTCNNNIIWSNTQPVYIGAGIESIANITQTTADVYLSGNSFVARIVEYGLPGFTPGAGATAGQGGTIISAAPDTTHILITGLIPFSMYNVYVRKFCNGSWSQNSAAAPFSTEFDCNNSPVTTNGQMMTLTIPPGWNSANGYPVHNGREVFFKFTPTVTGNHVIFIPPVMDPAYVNDNVTSFSYKASASGCNGQGFAFIGYSNKYTNSQKIIGPLNAGTEYYIKCLAIPSTGSTASFRIESPNCAQPSNPVVTAVTATGVSISWTGSASVLEYGPRNFVPGTGAMAGPGGTILPVSGNSYSIGNLTPGVVYDIYLRNYCGGTNYSPNSFCIMAQSLSCPNFSIYSPPGATFTIHPAGPGNYNFYPPNCNGLPGHEYYYQFTAPSSGNYKISINPAQTNGTYLLRTGLSTFDCNQSAYTCFPNSLNNTYNWGPLTAGLTYNLLFDINDTSYANQTTTLTFSISCPAPASPVITDIQPNSVNVAWSCTSCPASVFLEYGPYGFTPGTGLTAGINGTIITPVSTPIILNGLVTDSKYDVYLRSNCGGNFTANTAVTHFQTAISCDNAPLLSCGDHFEYSIPASNLASTGAWNITACGGSTFANEKIWRFTPGQTGSYSLLNYAFTSGSCCSGSVKVNIKQAGAICNETGWTCVSNTPGTYPYSILLGTLNAGTTYLIMMDATLSTLYAYNYYFRLECPNFCGSPKIKSATSGTPVSEVISMYCNSCFGNIILEFGPAGFVPGTDAVAGANGTVLAVPSFPYTITGLDSATIYHLYARTNCGSGGYSSNSSVVQFTTCGSRITPLGAVNICAGDSVLFSANAGGLAYYWKLNNVNIPGANSQTYYAKAAGNYSVQVNVFGCSFTSGTTSITMDSPPAASIVPAGSTTICSSGNVVLNANTGSGLTYQWKNNGNIISGATGSAYTASSAGNYTVYVTNSCGTAISSQVTVTVNPAPVASITPSGPTTFCSGGSVVLNANTGTGLTYQWKKNGTNISGVNSSSYVANASANYKVVITSSCGTATSANTTVTVNALPSVAVTAGGPTTFCSGGSVLLNAPVNAGYSYQWKKNGTNISGAIASSYSAAAAGTYKVTVTNSLTGCSKTSPTGIVVTVPAVTATITPQGPTSFCSGGSVILQANTGAALTYKWKKGSNFINGATASAYSATTAATYRVEVKNSNGCTKLSSGVTVSVPCREGETISAASGEIIAHVYPNPYEETFTLLINGNKPESFQVIIFDVLGRTMVSEKNIYAGQEIQLGKNLPAGIYLMELVSGERRKVIRVEKLR